MRNKTANLSGLALFLCVCILTASVTILKPFSGWRLLLGMAITQLLAFLVPTILIRITMEKTNRSPMRLILKIRSMQVFYFSICASMAVAIGGFLINFVLYKVGFISQLTNTNYLHAFDSENLLWPVYIIVALILPTILEEIFLRGALFSAHERMGGTGYCIILSGFCFAVLHSSLQNFIAPMIAGCLYAYLTYAFDCIWPAVLAHFVNNLYYLFVVWVTDIYSAFGIWKIFHVLSMIGFLLFAYLSTCILERLLERDQIKHFAIGDGIHHALRRTVFTLGFFIFLLSIVARIVLK